MFQTQSTSPRSGRGSWLVGLAAVALWIAAPVLAGGQLQQRPSSTSAKSSGSSSSSSSSARSSSGSSRSSAGSSNRGGSSRSKTSSNRGGSSRGSGGSGAKRSSPRPSTTPSGSNRKWRNTIDHRSNGGSQGRTQASDSPSRYRDRKWHPDNNPSRHSPTHRRNYDPYYPYYGGYHYGHHGYYGHYNPFWNFTFYGNYRYPAPWYPHQSYEGRELGGLDLNVRPKSTEVYLNGNFVGEAGNFDGYPRYLWLEDGVYEVIFYFEGFETVLREIEVVTGVVIDVQEDMQPGQAVLPEELSAIQPAADERVEVGTEWWREVSAQPPPQGLEPGSAPVIDTRAKPGRIRLTVAMDDASIYLDGQFVGTGRDLVGGNAAALLVDAGEHVLEIVHPRHESRKVEVTVAAGEEVEVDLGLGAEQSAKL